MLKIWARSGAGCKEAGIYLLEAYRTAGLARPARPQVSNFDQGAIGRSYETPEKSDGLIEVLAFYQVWRWWHS